MTETPGTGVSGEQVPHGAAPGIQAPPDPKGNVFLTSVDNIYNWGRARSMWPMMFGLACCAIEMIVVASARFDLSRFGMEIMRASPRQADLMIVSGTVTKKMVPNIVRLYNQMAEPKYVLAMGACATSGGPFKEGYNVVSGIDKFLPVDVYVPGCPPTPEALLYGLTKMHEKVFTQSVRTARWYRKDQLNEPIPLPILGPDLYDVRDYEALRIAAAKATGAANGEAQADRDGEGQPVHIGGMR
jgi:NADH-quinone oxidoreductase subunit B